MSRTEIVSCVVTILMLTLSVAAVTFGIFREAWGVMVCGIFAMPMAVLVLLSLRK